MRVISVAERTLMILDFNRKIQQQVIMREIESDAIFCLLGSKNGANCL